MNEHERPGHPAFDRLVAADPAKSAPDPVPGVLRAKVDALIAEQDGHAPDGHEPAGHQPAGQKQADELAVRRHRRRAPWLVAAAVAGVVVVGGGGYLAGESGVGVTTTSMDTGAAPDPAAGTESEDRSEDGEPSVLGAPEASPGGGAPDGVAPLDAAGHLPSATGLVFHAGAGLSDAARTGQVRVAEAGGAVLGAYPVVSEVEAVERLGDPRFAGTVVSRPARSGDQAREPSAGRSPAPGGSIAWPVEDVTVVSAKLTEVRYELGDGTVLLVPAYDLADADGGSWTVMAVDEELLDFAP